MMNKYPIVAMVLLLAGIALMLNCISCTSISCPFSGDDRSCHATENSSISCGGNCGNCSGNCTGNCTCPNGPAGAQNDSTEENCTALGSCPVKTVQ